MPKSDTEEDDNFVAPTSKPPAFMADMPMFHMLIMSNNLNAIKMIVETFPGNRDDLFVPDSYGRYPSNIAFLCEVDQEVCDYIVAQETKAMRRKGR